MEGIILTQSLGGGGGSSGNVPIEINIASGDTEQIDIYDASTCPFIRWHISAADRVSLTNSTRFLVVSALHDYEGNADHNSSSILGVEFDITISVTTGIPNTNLILSITNNELVDLDICAFRVASV